MNVKEALKKAESMETKDMVYFLRDMTPPQYRDLDSTPRWNFTRIVTLSDNPVSNAVAHLALLNKDLNQFRKTPILTSGELFDLANKFQGYEWTDVAEAITQKVLMDSDNYWKLVNDFSAIYSMFDFWVNKASFNRYRIMTIDQKAALRERAKREEELLKEKIAERQRILDELEANKGNASSAWFNY